MRYRVNGKAEEFDCPQCGAPVYSGETAWEDDGDCYCSAHCCIEHGKREHAAKLERLSVLARKMMLTPSQAVALPAAITCAAGKVGMPEAEFVAKCFAIPALAEYVANGCRTVTASV